MLFDVVYHFFFGKLRIGVGVHLGKCVFLRSLASLKFKIFNEMLHDVWLGLFKGYISFLVFVEIVEPLVDNTLDFAFEILGVGSWAGCWGRLWLWFLDLRGCLGI